ncbi:MAG TPA: CBS domain-containing protein [Rhizomicrobium sp.]|nr:CBS domain-containing protein [Rhizomicrobium sp.]
MRCAAIMTVNPPSVRDTDSIAEAATQLIAGRHLGLPVVDADGRYVGMFGTDDLLGLVVPRVAIAGGNVVPNLRFVGDNPGTLAERFREIAQQAVGTIADRTAIALAPDTPQIEAFRIFCRSRTSLPVVEPESRKLVGLVSYFDVMGAVTAGA